MPRAVRSHSNLPMPLFAANVPGSWATMLTSMLIAFSCDLITDATCWKSSGVENVDSLTEKPFDWPAAAISAFAFGRSNFWYFVFSSACVNGHGPYPGGTMAREVAVCRRRPC